jgi:hypothetical protein
MPISGKPDFQLGSGFWASTLEQDHHELLRYFSARAQEILAGLPACLPDNDRLELIVRGAVEARFLFFVAALADPTTEDLDEYFDHFVISSVSGIPDLGEERHDH